VQNIAAAKKFKSLRRVQQRQTSRRQTTDRRHMYGSCHKPKVT